MLIILDKSYRRPSSEDGSQKSTEIPSSALIFDRLGEECPELIVFVGIILMEDTLVGGKLPLSSGIRPLDEMLGGLEVGSLVLLEGDLSASSLSHLLAVRFQLTLRNALDFG